MANKFFTIMIVPEKTQQVRKIIIPNYVLKGGVLALAFVAVLAAIMILDYANVMNQISENKQLKVENRQLRQSVQVFKDKMVTIENTLDRVKTFATKLRIITNIEDLSLPMSSPITPDGLPQEAPAPQASPVKATPALETPRTTSVDTDTDIETDIVDLPDDSEAVVQRNNDQEASRKKRKVLLAALMASSSETATLTDMDSSHFVQAEFEKLGMSYEEVNKFATAVEQEVQHILERLGEKRSLLASTPTRIPTLGYITSEYGVRISPYDGRRKMHEGIDIAAPYGELIIAPADGVISFAGVKPGYGKMLEIDHGNGLETLYAHTSKLFVKAGEKVRRNQKLAAVGNTGHSTGPHLHYEVRANGLPIDPCWYVLDVPTFCRQR